MGTPLPLAVLTLARAGAAALVLSTVTGCIGGGPGPASRVRGPGDATDLEPGVWNEIRPGGRSLCARGAPYAFWVYPGQTDRLVIDFIGGGACWSEATCAAGGRFDDSVDALRWAVDLGYSNGIYDKLRPDNPIHGAWHVMVPYCTGDVHWGDADVRYGPGDDAFVIRHRGAVNARAALDFTYRAMPRPERVVVTGCSAGAYGSALWSAHIGEHYDGVPMVQLGDSGAGIITDTFFRDSFPSWKAEAAFPRFIPELDPGRAELRALSLTDLYLGVARHMPSARFSEFVRMHDENQISYFTAMGGKKKEAWTEEMLASVSAIEQAAPNFGAFVAGGSGHCITVRDDMYTVQAGGTRFVDWFGKLVAGSVKPVRCVGDECDP